MARFVAVSILTNKACDICRCSFAHAVVVDKEFIELGGKFFIATEEFYQAIHIMWSEEGVLPPVAFAEVAGHVYTVGRVIRSAPCAVFHLRTYKLYILIEILLIVHGTAWVELGIFVLFHLLSHSSHTPIVDGIFHCYRSGFVHLIAWYKAEVHYIWHSFLLWIDGGSLHCGKCFFGIKSGEAFEVGIGNDWHCAVARHTVSFAALQCPYRQFIVLVINRNHGVHYVGHHFGIHEGEQRVECAISVPKR